MRHAAEIAENVEKKIAERRRAALEAEADAARAANLADVVASMKRDLERLEQRRDKFAKIGGGRVEQERESFDPRFHVVIRWRPLESQLTGDELAEALEPDLAHLRGEIAKAEAEIASFLG